MKRWEQLKVTGSVDALYTFADVRKEWRASLQQIVDGMTLAYGAFAISAAHWAYDMKLRQAFNCTAAVLAFALSGASALAAPVTQIWTNLNPDDPQGLFDEMAFRFVSQSNGQTGFSNVALRNPLNGWVLQGFDPQLTYANGVSGQTINFALTFEGAASDAVQWEVWYYLDHKKLGGALYTGNVGQTSFVFTVLENVGQPPSLPEPATALLVALALGGCVVARMRRSAVEATT